MMACETPNGTAGFTSCGGVGGVMRWAINRSATFLPMKGNLPVASS
jgi:hypothetical protein